MRIFDNIFIFLYTNLHAAEMVRIICVNFTFIKSFKKFTSCCAEQASCHTSTQLIFYTCLY